MTSEIDVFKDKPTEMVKSNREDGFSHNITGSSSTSKRISIRNNLFRLIINGEEISKSNQRHLDVVIVNASPSVHRMFYPEAYRPGTKLSPPSCWSSDAQVPDKDVLEPQHKDCSECPQNIKGSGPNNTKACRFSRRIAVVMADNLEGDVYQLTLPAQSIFGTGDDTGKPLNKYADYVKANKEAVGSVVTRMSFDENSSSTKVKFSPVSRLSDEEFEISKGQGATEDAQRAITLTVVKREPEVDEKDLPKAFRLTEKDESDEIEAEKKEAVAEPVKKKTSRKKKTKTETSQGDMFKESEDKPVQDTGDVSLDDLVSDWE
jgi:virulence-associated protein VagC|tara:strand:- start:8519 stop:9475 length:957 start_codon:yes stop_codon:yes gene_type:complete